MFYEREAFATEQVRVQLEADPSFDRTRPVVMVYGSSHNFEDNFAGLCEVFNFENLDMRVIPAEDLPTS